MAYLGDNHARGGRAGSALAEGAQTAHVTRSRDRARHSAVVERAGQDWYDSRVMAESVSGGSIGAQPRAIAMAPGGELWQQAVVIRYSPKRGLGFVETAAGKQVEFQYPLEHEDYSPYPGLLVDACMDGGRARIRLPMKFSGCRSEEISEGERQFMAALAFREAGNLDGAEKQFRALVDSGKAPLDAVLELAKLRQTTSGSAIEILRNGLKQFPISLKLRTHLADLLGQEQRWAESLGILCGHLESHPPPETVDPLRVACRLAWEYYRKGELAQRADALRRIGSVSNVLERVDSTDLQSEENVILVRRMAAPTSLLRQVIDWLRDAGAEVEHVDFRHDCSDLRIRIRDPRLTEGYPVAGILLVRLLEGEVRRDDIDAAWKTLGDWKKRAGREANDEVAILVGHGCERISQYVRRLVADGRQTVILIDVRDLSAPSPPAVEVLAGAIKRDLRQRDLFAWEYPVFGRRFFGREVEFRQLNELLRDGAHVGLYGLRKMGKTSFLRQLSVQSQHDLVAYVDLQATPGAARHTPYLYWAVARAVHGQTVERQQQLGCAVRLELGLKETWDSGHQAMSKNGIRCAADLERVLEALRKRSGSDSGRIILAVDELEHIRQFQDYEEFLAWLRGMSQQTSGAILSVAAAANPALSDSPRLEGKDNPIFQFYREMYIPPLRPSECQEMIERLSLLMGVRFEEDAVEGIIHETGGHPFLTRRLCSALLRGESRPNRVRRALLDAAIPRFLQECDPVLEEIAGRLQRDFAEEMEILKLIHSGCNRRDDLVDLVGPDLERVIRHLVGYHLVKEEEGHFRVALNLLRSWLDRREGRLP